MADPLPRAPMPEARDAGALPKATARRSRPSRRAKQAAARRARLETARPGSVAPAPVDDRTTPHWISAQASAPSSGNSSVSSLCRGAASPATTARPRHRPKALSVEELTARLEAVVRHLATTTAKLQVVQRDNATTTAKLGAVERESIEAEKRHSKTMTTMSCQIADYDRRLATTTAKLQVVQRDNAASKVHHATTTARLSMVESNVKTLNAYVAAHDPLFEVEQMAVHVCDVTYHTLALQMGGLRRHASSRSPMVNWAARKLGLTVTRAAATPMLRRGLLVEQDRTRRTEHLASKCQRSRGAKVTVVVPDWVAVLAIGRNGDAHEFGSYVGLASLLSKAEVKRVIDRIRKKGQEVIVKLEGSSVASSAGTAAAAASSVGTAAAAASSVGTAAAAASSVGTAAAAASSAGVAQAISDEGVSAVRKHLKSMADLIDFAAEVKSLV